MRERALLAAAAAGDARRGRSSRPRTTRSGTRRRAATAARGRACSARASTSSGRRSTATSPTRTGSAAPGGCGPTSAASTSTCSSRCARARLFLVTGWELLVLVILAQHTIVLQQLLPLLRFDGYYVVSDLTGVPDILSRIKPIFASLVPGREPDPRVDGAQALGAGRRDRVRARAHPGAAVHARDDGDGRAADVRDGLRLAGAAGRPARARRTASPPAPVGVLSGARAGAAVPGDRGQPGAGGHARRRRRAAAGPRPARRGRAGAAVAVVLVGFAAYTWWPNGDYEPLRPGERARSARRSAPCARSRAAGRRSRPAREAAVRRGADGARAPRAGADGDP